MFSSATDRFFHGINKKNTKMIDTANLKASLQLSRSQKQNNSRSKTTKIFSPAHTSVKSTTFNISFQNSNRSMYQKNQNQKFGPPIPFNQNQSHFFSNKRRAKFKLNLQANCPDTSQLNSLIQKHINKQDKRQIFESQCSATDEKSNKQIFMLSTLSIKDKLRKRVEADAIRKYSNINSNPTQKNNTQRVSIQITKNLQHILNKDKTKTQFNQRKSIHENEKKFQTNFQRQRNINQKIKDKEQILQSDQQESEYIQSENHEPLQRETPKLKLPQTSKNNQISKKQPLKAELKQDQINQTLQLKLNKQLNNQQLLKKEKNISQIRNKQEVTQQKINQINAIKQLKAKPIEEQKKPPSNQNINNQKRKSNTFWNDEMQTAIISQQKNTVKKNSEVKSIKQTIKLPVPGQTINKKNNFEQKIKQQKKIQPKIDVHDYDQLQEIQFQQPKQKRPSIKKDDQKLKQTKKYVNSIEATMAKVPPKQTQQISNKIIQQNKQKKQSQSQKKQAQKSKPIPEKKVQKTYNIQQITTTTQNILYTISQLGSYGNNLKVFYQKIIVEQFNKEYKILAYYLWQHLYYLRQKCLMILTNKNQNFFNIPYQALKLQQLQQFIDQQIDDIQQQNNSVRQRIKKLHEIAKQYLPPLQKNIEIDEKTNYHDRCLKLLQKQFTQIQKLYKKAIKNSDKKQPQYVQKICQIIEIVCLLKFFNGDKTKQYQELQDIQNLFNHYQSYKHLVVL